MLSDSEHVAAATAACRYVVAYWAQRNTQRIIPTGWKNGHCVCLYANPQGSYEPEEWLHAFDFPVEIAARCVAS